MMEDSERLIEDDEFPSIGALQIDDMNFKHRVSPAKVGRFKLYSSKVNWKIFFAISIFTLGSWLDLAGVWSELPYFVATLPEGWRLPAILSAITQLAQIAPLVLLLCNCFLPNKSNFVPIIYGILAVGCVSCLFLALTWDKTANVLHEQRSIYLYVFNFFLSILDGMSSITFLPYVGCHFTKEYILPNYVGESLSSFIPGLLALFQGINRGDKCINSISTTVANISKPITAKHLVHQQPNYPVSVYFLLMLLLLCMSVSAFSYLNFSKCALNERKRSEKLNQYELDTMSQDTTPRAFRGINADSDSVHSNEFLESLGKMDGRPSQIDNQNNSDVGSTGSFIINQIGQKLSHKQKREINLLLVITFFTSFINYGYLSSFLSYSTLPYGDAFFNLSINLSSIIQPISIFLSIWSYVIPIKKIFLESAIAFALSVYIVAIGILSPCPPLVNYPRLGGTIIVIVWVLVTSLFMRVRCLIATRLDQYDKKNILVQFGIVTLIGQIFGGFLSYLGIEILRLLKEKTPCVPSTC